MKNSILIIDIETSGFLKSGGEILEIGMVALNVETGDTKILYNAIVRESGADALKGSEWIFKNSTLNLLDVLTAPTVTEEKEKIQSIIDQFNGRGVTAYNNAFDFDFMESRGFVFNTKLPCPMKLLTPILKIPAKNGKSGNKWPSVEEAFRIIFKNEDYQEEHRAGKDALDEAAIVYQMILAGQFPTLPQ